jgi:hypothetical protein
MNGATTMENEYNLQFCDAEANQDISGSPAAERDATEIRLWHVGGTLIVAVEKNARSGCWHISGSDYIHWTGKARSAFRDWRDAMRYAGPDVREYLTAAGY